MPYEKPKCECDGELVTWSERVYTENYKVTNNGQQSKKVYNRTLAGEGAWSRLECIKCSNQYSWESDERGRIIRGDQWKY